MDVDEDIVAEPAQTEILLRSWRSLESEDEDAAGGEEFWMTEKFDGFLDFTQRDVPPICDRLTFQDGDRSDPATQSASDAKRYSEVRKTPVDPPLQKIPRTDSDVDVVFGPSLQQVHRAKKGTALAAEAVKKLACQILRADAARQVLLEAKRSVCRKWQKEQVCVPEDPYLGHYRYRQLPNDKERGADGDVFTDISSATSDNFVVGKIYGGKKAASSIKAGRKLQRSESKPDIGGSSAQRNKSIDAGGENPGNSVLYCASSDEDSVLVLGRDGWKDAKKLKKRPKKWSNDGRRNRTEKKTKNNRQQRS